jgi:hypothetical protein
MTLAVAGALALQDVTEAAAVVVLFSMADWMETSCTATARNAISAVLALKPATAVLAGSGAAGGRLGENQGKGKVVRGVGWKLPRTYHRHLTPNLASFIQHGPLS